MKTILTIIFALIFASAHANTITVPVVKVTPIVINQSKLVKTDFCQPVIVQNNGIDGTTIGTIIGAVLGSSINGDNNDRRLYTGVGSVIGSKIGSRYNKPTKIERTEICDYRYTSQTQKVIDGYKVVYDLNGRLNSIKMNYHPGNYITLETTTRVR